MNNIFKDINILDYPELYYDYEISLNFLRNYRNSPQKKNNIINFHIYTDLTNPKEYESIKSFFATQDLKRAKLFVWSDQKINFENLKREIGDFIYLITFKIYNPIKLSKNSPLENFKHIEKNDKNFWLKSDLFRLLVCYQYGGIYLDMDIILLNDFYPLFEIEFFYQWGGSNEKNINACCASVMKLNKKSPNAELLLKNLRKKFFVRKGTTSWGKDLFSKTNFNNKLKILPSTFFDTEWNISLKDKELSNKLTKSFFSKKLINKKFLFYDAFSWHWHNSSNKNKKVLKGSKFYLLKKFNDKMIRQKSAAYRGSFK